MTVSARPKFLLALGIAIFALVLAFAGCAPDNKPLAGQPSDPPTDGGTPPGESCVPSCVDRPCGPESSTCATNCDPGSGCYIPTGYCVPDANGLCPVVPPPACEPVACTPVACEPVDCVPVDPPCEHKFPKTHPCCNGLHLGDKHCEGVVCDTTP